VTAPLDRRARVPLVEPGPPLSRAQRSRYARQLVLDGVGDEGQRRLLAAKVLVVGAGGLGSPVLQYLAAAGVGTIGVIDGDLVERSNLQRQVVHTDAAVGTSKTASATQRIEAINPDVTVEAFPLFLDASGADDLLGDFDLVVDGSDNFTTRYLVSDVCARLGIPHVWGSVLRFDGQVSTFTAGATLRHLHPESAGTDDAESCEIAGVLGSLCGWVGSVMAAEVVKLVLGVGEPLVGRVLVIDALTGSQSEIPFGDGHRGERGAADAAAGADPPGTTDAAGARDAVGTTAGAGTADAAGRGAEVAAPVAEPGRLDTVVDVVTAQTPTQVPGSVGAAPTADAGPAAPAGPVRSRSSFGGRQEGVGADDFLAFVEQGALPIDVRREDEDDPAPLPGARRVPHARLLEADEVLPDVDRSTPLAVYCASGRRAALVAPLLREAGFTRVLTLTGPLPVRTRERAG